MRIIYDFKCQACGNVSERMVESDCYSVECKLCTGQSTRLISAPAVQLDPVSGDFPGATIKWARAHEKLAHKGNE